MFSKFGEVALNFSDKKSSEFVSTFMQDKSDSIEIGHIDMDRTIEVLQGDVETLLPAAHFLYESEEYDFTFFIAWEVLEHLADGPSIDLLLKNEEDLEKAELEELAGFVEYLKHNEDPFVNRDMSMFEPTPEEKLALNSLLPTENTVPGSVNQEVIRKGVIRVQYPKAYWSNQKQRKFNSIIGKDGRLLLGVKALWPANMSPVEIEKITSWARKATQNSGFLGVRAYQAEVYLIGIAEEDRSLYTVSPKWEQAPGDPLLLSNQLTDRPLKDSSDPIHIKEFDKRFAMYKDYTYFGTAQYMMDVFDAQPEELLPHIHQLMDKEDHPFFKEILAVMVADVLPDKRSIEMLINEYGADEADFKEMAGFEKYCAQHGNPFEA